MSRDLSNRCKQLSKNARVTSLQSSPLNIHRVHFPDLNTVGLSHKDNINFFDNSQTHPNHHALHLLTLCGNVSFFINQPPHTLFETVGENPASNKELLFSPKSNSVHSPDQFQVAPYPEIHQEAKENDCYLSRSINQVTNLVPNHSLLISTQHIPEELPFTQALPPSNFGQDSFLSYNDPFFPDEIVHVYLSLDNPHHTKTTKSNIGFVLHKYMHNDQNTFYNQQWPSQQQHPQKNPKLKSPSHPNILYSTCKKASQNFNWPKFDKFVQNQFVLLFTLDPIPTISPCLKKIKIISNENHCNLNKINNFSKTALISFPLLQYLFTKTRNKLLGFKYSPDQHRFGNSQISINLFHILHTQINVNHLQTDKSLVWGRCPAKRVKSDSNRLELSVSKESAVPAIAQNRGVLPTDDPNYPQHRALPRFKAVSIVSQLPFPNLDIDTITTPLLFLNNRYCSYINNQCSATPSLPTINNLISRETSTPEKSAASTVLSSISSINSSSIL